MSRSALQTSCSKIQQAPHGLIRHHDVESAPTGKHIEMHGNQETHNINALLSTCIMQSEYFRSLYEFKTYHEVIDEIFNQCSHAEPWATGTSRVPSALFCLMKKFMLMKLTHKQMDGLLNHPDSPYIRAVGFLYLRFTCAPKDLWEWFEPFLMDPYPINPTGDSKAKPITVGEYCESLLTDMSYFGTMLPRIPVPIERDMKVKFLMMKDKKTRARANVDLVYELAVGSKLEAQYTDEAGTTGWYSCVIEKVEPGGRYLVRFEDYGNQEVVSLGEIRMPGQGGEEEEVEGGGDDRDGGRRSRSPRESRRERSPRDDDRDRDRRRDDRRGSRDRGGRDRRDRDYDRRDRSDRDSDRRGGSRRDGRRDRDRDRDRDGRRGGGRDDREYGRYSRSGSRDGSGSAGRGGGGASASDLLQQVMEAERRKAMSSGKDYASRPASYKGSLALKVDRYTSRRRSRSRSPPPRGPAKVARRSSSPRRDEPQVVKKAPLDPASMDRLKTLREKYGDASKQ